MMRVMLGAILAASIAAHAPAEEGRQTKTFELLAIVWRDCVFRSFATQSAISDRSLAAELAFVACATEEQAFVSMMKLAHIPNDMAGAIISNSRLLLKRQMAQ